MSADRAEAASDLCVTCGMCCNGVLFEIVKLRPDDSVRDLEALGMQIRRKKKAPYFVQPCAFLAGCACSHYEARPQRCREFECRVLTRVATGEMTGKEAHEKIDEVKRRVATLDALLPELVDKPLAERAAAAAAVPEIAALQALLDAEFRPH